MRMKTKPRREIETVRLTSDHISYGFWQEKNNRPCETGRTCLKHTVDRPMGR
jgi:hypothetical protein